MRGNMSSPDVKGAHAGSACRATDRAATTGAAHGRQRISCAGTEVRSDMGEGDRRANAASRWSRWEYETRSCAPWRWPPSAPTERRQRQRACTGRHTHTPCVNAARVLELQARWRHARDARSHCVRRRSLRALRRRDASDTRAAAGSRQPPARARAERAARSGSRRQSSAGRFRRANGQSINRSARHLSKRRISRCRGRRSPAPRIDRTARSRPPGPHCAH